MSKNTFFLCFFLLLKLKLFQLVGYEIDLNKYLHSKKSNQAIKHNDKAQSLNKIKIYAKQRTDRLSYIANSIKNLSDILIAIQRMKVTKHGQ